MVLYALGELHAWNSTAEEENDDVHCTHILPQSMKALVQLLCTCTRPLCALTLHASCLCHSVSKITLLLPLPLCKNSQNVTSYYQESCSGNRSSLLEAGMPPSTLSCASSSSFSMAAVAFSKSCAYTESTGAEKESTQTFYRNNIHDGRLSMKLVYNFVQLYTTLSSHGWQHTKGHHQVNT